jgi:hypothetical protein
MPVECAHQSITPTPVDLTRSAEVALERTTFQELRKRELVGDRRATVCLQLGARDVCNEVGRYQDPGEAKGR